MSKQEHPYAQVLRWIADGEDVDVRYGDGTWEAVSGTDALSQVVRNPHRNPDDFRLKPRTIKIGAYDVPEPMRGIPKVGAVVFTTHMTVSTFSSEDVWNGDENSITRLAQGRIHHTREAAELHALALLSFTTTQDDQA